ncbi:calcium-binding protein [Novosphingobium sp.]|uniref:calcium-binding protein n=1 Tax=Novosphingobium sp. TaxID=1874826 RepID=UPI0028A75C8D|nr:calcium-binding protein [Novosphingobium sp.]
MSIVLGAQTHFSQGWSTSLLDAAGKLGADSIRDSVPWAAVENVAGKYDFSVPQAAWVDQALGRGFSVTLTFANANPLHDQGYTVYSDAGRAAFADFVVATLKQYPGVQAIEIGNEYNSNSFVTGPIASASAATRDDYYAKLVAAVDRALGKAGIDVELVGGATHSIPVDYFSDLKALGTLDILDAISIHPYTTPPEQFADQIAALRGVVGNEIDIRVTEFGGDFTSLNDAPAYFAKMLSVMGAAGIESASWYALARQSYFPNMELWNTTAASAAPAGETFRVFDGLLKEGDTIARVATDDFTYFYTLGREAAVLWGQTGSVTLASGVSAYDLRGNRIAEFDGKISADVPILLKSEGGISAASVQFHVGALVADSFDQFDVTNTDGGGAGFEGPWSYYSRSGSGQTLALQTMGGGLKSGEPWTPYLGSQWLRPLTVNATTVTPADFSNGTNAASRYAVVERYTVQNAGLFRIEGDYDVSDQSRDGIYLTVTVNDRQILQQHVYDPAQGNRYDFTLDHVRLAAGDRVEFVVSSGASAVGDATSRHIRIFSEPVAIGSEAGALGDWREQTSGVRLDLSGGNVVVDGKRLATSVIDAIGSGFNDILSGDAHANRFHGGDGDDRLHGLGGDDVLVGGGGADRLDGGSGADRMEGGSGDDTYYVDDTRDQVIETDAAGGIDVVRSEVDFTLGDHLEQLYLIGTADINGSGNALANILYGNDGDNVLSGGGGADKLQGGGGADIFLYDSLESAASADTILDFQHGLDRIAIDREAFAGLAGRQAGALETLAIRKTATAPDMHVFYDPGVGTLYYDVDGSGSAAAIAMATLRGKPMIDATDVVLF